MAITLVTPSAKNRTVYRRKAASTAIAEGQFLVENGTGEVTPMTNPNEERVVGQAKRTVTSASSDYASTTLIAITVDEDGVWEADNTDTATEATEGTYIDFDSSAPSTSVASDNSTYDQFYVTKFVSASKLQGNITRWASSEPPATN